MKKTLTIICAILLIALNIIVIYSAIFASTNGLNKSSTIKWTEETEIFVEENFGHYETDYEKAVAFKDWIVNNIKYTPYAIPLIQTVDVDEVIESRSGICFEQASLFTVFCRISGIECYNVDGRAKSNFASTHSWNRFCIDGQWYEIDITHDQSAMKKDKALYGVNEISDLDAPDKSYNIYRIY